MPRVLPWLKAGHEPPGGGSSASSAPKSKKPKLQPAYRAFRSDGQNNSGCATNQGSSISPPSSPVEPPPPIEEMKPGDEDWVMVEDELYSTAQLFTRHLHRAEYKKLQKIAKENANMSAVVRPTVGINQNANTQRAKQRRHQMDNAVGEIRRDTSEESEGALEEEEDLIVDDRDLAGLLFGEENAKDLSPRQMSDIASAKPKTRAAAGLGRQRDGRRSSLPIKRAGLRHATASSRHTTIADDGEGEDDDDLDALAGASSRTKARSSLKEPDDSARRRRDVRDSTLPTDDVPSSPPVTGSRQPIPETARSAALNCPAPNDLDHAREPEDESADAKMAKWKERREARRQAKVKLEDRSPPSSPPKQSMNDIPMFLG